MKEDPSRYAQEKVEERQAAVIRAAVSLEIKTRFQLSQARRDQSRVAVTRTAGLPAGRSARPVQNWRDLRPVSEIEHEARDEQHHKHYPWNHATNRDAILRRHRVNQCKF